MMEDVRKMEQQLLEQEKFFRKQKEGVERDPYGTGLNELR
jgi:hypothetical protein